MLFRLLTLTAAVCLVSADFTCPEGKVTCADGKGCCDLTPGTPTSKRSLSPLGGPTPYDFCPYTTGKKICCNPPSNCLAGSECCNANTCCVRGFRCCGNGQWCCKKKQICGPYYNTCQ